MENMEQDYQARPELDQFEDVGMDDDDHQELSYGARQEVDRRLNAEDRIKMLAGNRKMPGAFAEDMEGDDDGE